MSLDDYEYDELLTRVAVLEKAYGGLTLGKHGHDMIRKAAGEYGSIMNDCQVLIGSSGLLLRTVFYANGAFKLEIQDFNGYRLWEGTWCG